MAGVSGGKLFHKPQDKAIWMQRYVVVNGPSVRVFGNREEFQALGEPLYDLELFSDSSVREGTHKIVRMGTMEKKAWKWTARWCSLLATGYLQYTDAELRTPKLIDLFETKIEIAPKNLTISLKPKTDKNIMLRCKGIELLNDWHASILQVQRDCARVRRASSTATKAGEEPTVFPFTVQQSPAVHHCFCCSSEEQLKMWVANLEIIIKKVDAAHTSVSAGFVATKGRAVTIGRGTVARSAGTFAVGSAAAEAMTDEELDKAMHEMIDDMKMPEVAAQRMYELPYEQKMILLKQHKARSKVKTKQSGKDWSLKFAKTDAASPSLMQNFCVVLRDEAPDFVLEFIHEMGLTHLCTLATTKKHDSMKKEELFDRELLSVFLAIVNTPGTILELATHDRCIRALVAKLGSMDVKTRENALKVLFTVAADDTDYGLMASRKMLEALSDEATATGSGNKWEFLAKHLSAKVGAEEQSAMFDLHCISIINLLLMPMEPERRIPECRLLGALHFDRALKQIQDRARRGVAPFNVEEEGLVDSLNQQIDAFKQLSEEDKRFAKAEGVANADLSNPMELFQLLHDQSLKDHSINELTQILTNLLSLPESAGSQWVDISRVVAMACAPTQRKLATGSMAKSFVKRITHLSDTGYDEHGEVHYPTFAELAHFMKARGADPATRKARGDAAKLEKIQHENMQLEKELREATRRVAELESAPPKVVIKEVPTAGIAPSTTSSVGRGAAAAASPPPDPKSALMGMIAKRGGGGPTPAAASSSGGGAAAVDPWLKYRKMLKIGMPKPAVANKMRSDKVDPAIIEELDAGGDLPPPPGGSAAVTTSSAGPSAMAAPTAAPKKAAASGGPPKLSAEEEAQVAKFRKMQKMRMPDAAVRNKMLQAKVDANLIAKFFGESASAGGGGAKKKKEAKPEIPPGMRAKKEMKPKAKLRNLHWTKVNPYQVEKTIWKDICYDDQKMKIDFKPFEASFASKPSAMAAKSGGAAKSAPATDGAKVSLLDPKRSYNIEIFLGRLGKDSYTVRKALLEFDATVLPLSMIEKLKNFVPTPDEAAMVAEHSPQSLARPEAFFAAIGSVDVNLIQRLQIWEFQLNFGSLKSAQEEKVQLLVRANKAINESKRFKRMLTYILAFGNYMNGGTKKGKAFGFKLASLSQLSRSKTIDNQSNLLEFIYRYLFAKDADTLKWTDDLSSLDVAVSVDIPTLRKDVGGIRGKLNLIKGRLDKASKDPKSLTRGDMFVRKFQAFHKKSAGEFDAMSAAMDGTLKKVVATAKWLNEDKDMTGVYLKTVNEFRKELMKLAKKEAAATVKAAAAAKRKKKQFAPSMTDVLAASSGLKSSKGPMKGPPPAPRPPKKTSVAAPTTVADANLAKASTTMWKRRFRRGK